MAFQRVNAAGRTSILPNSLSFQSENNSVDKRTAEAFLRATSPQMLAAGEGFGSGDSLASDLTVIPLTSPSAGSALSRCTLPSLDLSRIERQRSKTAPSFRFEELFEPSELVLEDTAPPTILTTHTEESDSPCSSPSPSPREPSPIEWPHQTCPETVDSLKIKYSNPFHITDLIDDLIAMRNDDVEEGVDLKLQDRDRRKALLEILVPVADRPISLEVSYEEDRKRRSIGLGSSEWRHSLMNLQVKERWIIMDYIISQAPAFQYDRIEGHKQRELEFLNQALLRGSFTEKALKARSTLLQR